MIEATTAFDEASRKCAGSTHHESIREASEAEWAEGPTQRRTRPGEVVATNAEPPKAATAHVRAAKRQRTVSNNGAGNGIRTRDFDLGKVALYH